MNPTPALSPLPQQQTPPQAAAPGDRFAIQCEVLRLSVRPIGPVLLVQYLLNCGVAALFAWQYSPARALVWIALITGVTAMRGFFPQRLPEPFTPATLREAQRTHTVRTGIWELAHGLAGVLLFNPASADLQLLLGLILMGMTLSSAFSVSFYTPATQLAITLLLAPIIVTGIWLGAPLMIAVAVIGIGLTAMMWKLVAERSRQLEENIGLRLNERTLREQALAGLRASEQAQAERLRFFSAANHDLRQPVMAIGLQAEVLRQQLDSGAGMQAVQHTVGSLARAQQALEGLTNQLLEIGRIEAAVDPLRPAAVALAPLLHELARQAGDARVTVRCPGGAVAWTDAVSLRRVLANLVDNAVKFTPRGRVLLAVRARRRNGGLAWRVEVRDSGIGIAAEAQARVFDDFEQIGNVERNLQRGHGLGLAIVRRLAAHLGIAVWLRSAPGRGSVFSFELPAAAPDAVAALPAATPRAEGARRGAGAAPRHGRAGGGRQHGGGRQPQRAAAAMGGGAARVRQRGRGAGAGRPARARRGAVRHPPAGRARRHRAGRAAAAAEAFAGHRPDLGRHQRGHAAARGRARLARAAQAGAAGGAARRAAEGATRQVIARITARVMARSDGAE
jgi:signal transduction histidine kinase